VLDNPTPFVGLSALANFDTSSLLKVSLHPSSDQQVGATPGIEPRFLTLYPDHVVDLGQRRFARRLVVSVLSVGRRRYLSYDFTSCNLGLPAAFA
jgi:hypothetical protein